MQIWLEITRWLEWSVLAMLLVLSIWSVSIMIDRKRTLRLVEADAPNAEWRKLISGRDWSGLRSHVGAAGAGLRAGAVAAALEATRPEALTGNPRETAVEPAASHGFVDRAVRSYLTEERLRLERGLPVLATLGANAPFIGLFGTVLGIIQAFAALSTQSGEAASVMAGVSRALYATAAGLFVAIPAVVAFNYFSNRIRRLLSECEALKDHYLSQSGRNS